MPIKPLRFLPLACISTLPSLLSAQLTLTLTSSNYNGYSTPCFGQKSGSITLTVTGGVPPYTYAWTNGDTSKDLDGLPAGYYGVSVKDSHSIEQRAEITLTEPERLQVTTTSSSFPNGHNISCFECSNGSIQTVVTKGTAPYSFAWTDGPSTAQNRYSLGPQEYAVIVTDANGCVDRARVRLSQPERSDWTMSGNAGTNPATQFIGTTDNKDLVFKSNNTERLRLISGGDVKISSLVGSGNRILYTDNNGILKKAPSTWNLTMDPWLVGGNGSVAASTSRIGPMNNVDLSIITNDTEQMRITSGGKVGLGCVPPTGVVDGWRLFVEDGIVARDVLVKLGAWPDYVFADDHELMPLGDLRAYLKQHRHLPGIPAAAELEEQGGVALGDMQRDLTRTVEEQALYILQLEEKYHALEQRLKALEASHR